MNAPGRFLILTPTLGDTPLLAETMASVACLGLDVLHILSVPAARVDDLAARYPQCRVVPDAGKTGGLYGALNAGLDAARGDAWDWFTYINDDDLIAPAFRELVRRHCRPENLATVAYGDIDNIDGAGRSLGRMTVEPHPARLPALLQQSISPLGQQGTLFGRPVVEALGGYTLEYKIVGDADYWVRAYAQGFRFQYYPLLVGQFRLRAGQISGDPDLTRRELADSTRKHLPQPTSPFARRYARLRYRIYNAPRYLARWRAVGWTSSDGLLLGSGGTRPT